MVSPKPPNSKETRGGKKKVKVMLRAKGQILFCRGNVGTKRKCRLIENGLCWLKFASIRALSAYSPQEQGEAGGSTGFGQGDGPSVRKWLLFPFGCTTVLKDGEDSAITATGAL